MAELPNNDLGNFAASLDGDLFKNPLVDQALDQAARERVQAVTETASRSAGITGGAQVQFQAGALSSALQQSFTAALGQEQQQRQQLLQFRLESLKASGQLDSARYQAELQAETQLRLAQMQSDAAFKSGVVGAVGGLAGAGLAGYFGRGEGDSDG